MRTSMRRVLGLLCVMLALPAVAQAEVEPNNTFIQAEGPLSAAAPTTGAIFNNEDRDWFVVYVNGQTQTDIVLTATKANSCTLYAYMYDTDCAGRRRGHLRLVRIGRRDRTHPVQHARRA